MSMNLWATYKGNDLGLFQTPSWASYMCMGERTLGPFKDERAALVLGAYIVWAETETDRCSGWENLKELKSFMKDRLAHTKPLKKILKSPKGLVVGVS